MENLKAGTLIAGFKISNLRCADDTTLVSKDMEEMRILLEKLDHVSREYGLKINKDKRKLMIIDRARSIPQNERHTEGL